MRNIQIDEGERGGESRRGGPGGGTGSGMEWGMRWNGIGWQFVERPLAKVISS